MIDFTGSGVGGGEAVFRLKEQVISLPVKTDKKLGKSVVSEWRDLRALGLCGTMDWGRSKREGELQTNLLRIYLWLVLPSVEMVRKIL